LETKLFIWMFISFDISYLTIFL